MLRVVAALLLASTPLLAQVYDRPLTEQDLQRLMPVLQADKTGAARLAKQAQERQALEADRAKARQAVVEKINAGLDPLEWLQQIAPAVATPSTARYEAACSRAHTAAAKDPSAVFTFGMAAPPAWLRVWHARDQSVPIGDRTQSSERPGAPRPGATRPEQVAQQTRAFYSSREFQYQGEPAPFEWQFLTPDRRVSATVMGVNVLGHTEPCRALPTGPTILLKAEGEAFAKGPEKTPATTNWELAEALEKAGISQSDYLNAKLQLLTARADAGDPSRLAALAPTTDEQRKAIEIRRENAGFYRAHERTLAPLLEGLSQ